MAARYRPRRRLPSCGSVALAAAVCAAGVWVVVRAIVAWVTGHPGAVVGMVAMVALGGAGLARLPGRAATRQVRHIQAVREFTALNPAEFEQAVAGLCWRDGCRDVRVVGGAGDLAADVLATTPGGKRILIQCKRYAAHNMVGSDHVQRVNGTYRDIHHCEQAIIVTTSGYTRDATSLARRVNIRLVDGDDLARWAAGGRPPWA